MHVKEKAKCCQVLELAQTLRNVCEFNSYNVLIWGIIIHIFTCQTLIRCLLALQVGVKNQYSPSFLSFVNQMKEAVIGHFTGS